jgi:hypothetical protein
MAARIGPDGPFSRVLQDGDQFLLVIRRIVDGKPRRYVYWHPTQLWTGRKPMSRTVSRTLSLKALIGPPRGERGPDRSTVETRARTIWFPAASMFLKTAVAPVPLNAAVALRVGAAGRVRRFSGSGAVAGQ